MNPASHGTVLVWILKMGNAQHDVNCNGKPRTDFYELSIQLFQNDYNIERGIGLILTSHYTVENLEDVKAKISYLKELKNIAVKSTDAAGFKGAVQKKYPLYSGVNYLDMSAGMFFPAK